MTALPEGLNRPEIETYQYLISVCAGYKHSKIQTTLLDWSTARHMKIAYENINEAGVRQDNISRL
jgi:hypothetical protein